MIESLEGHRGQPRLKPPYPAQVGLWGQPTLVQNVETLANIPHIIQRGAEWYASIGTSQSKGPKIFCVSGHVNRPGNYELPLGVTLREVIYEHAGGVRLGRNVKAVIPGGASTPIMTGDQLDTPMAFETLQAAGSALGHWRGDRHGRNDRHGRSGTTYHEFLRPRVVRRLHALPYRRRAAFAHAWRQSLRAEARAGT